MQPIHNIPHGRGNAGAREKLLATLHYACLCMSMGGGPGRRRGGGRGEVVDIPELGATINIPQGRKGGQGEGMIG